MQLAGSLNIEVMLCIGNKVTDSVFLLYNTIRAHTALCYSIWCYTVLYFTMVCYPIILYTMLYNYYCIEESNILAINKNNNNDDGATRWRLTA